MKTSFSKAIKNKLKGGWPEDNLGYRVNVGRYTYYIRISPQKDGFGNVFEYVMDLGGRKRGCVSLRIPTLAPEYPNGSNTKQALLKYVQFNPMCSANSDRDLVSGFGTKHMLKTALHFAKELCPNTDIQSFRFIDTSRKLCSDGVTIDLPYFMIALYGKTYYEKYFFARLQKDHDHTQYKSYLEKLKTVPLELMTFNIFAHTYHLNENQINTLEPLYNAAKTFREFFASIRDKHPDTICKLMQGWVNRFVVNYVFSGDDIVTGVWIIPAAKIPDIEVENWEVIARDSVEMNILNKEQQGGESDKDNQYLGLYDPKEDY